MSALLPGFAEPQEPLLARADEQERFRALLRIVAGLAAIDGDSSWITLVHGQGGIGKSTLLSRFREIARGDLPADRALAGKFITLSVDWEQERELSPVDYPGDRPPGLGVVLQRLYQSVAGAVEPRLAERAFDSYRQAATNLADWHAWNDQIRREAQAGTVSVSDEERMAIAGLFVKLALAIPNPAALLGVTPDVAAAAAGAPGAASGLQKLIRRRRGGHVDPDDFLLLTNPEGELCARLAHGIRSLSADRPLVICLDTYEIVQQLGPWLIEAMRRAGGRVVWVLGSRLEPEQEALGTGGAAQFHRRVPADRLIAMPLHRLDDQAVREYLADRVPGRTLTGQEVDRIAEFTRGVPLALSIAARMLRGGIPVAEVCASYSGDRPARVVAAMAERYLIHARTAAGLAGDLPRIYGLALMRSESGKESELLQALWGADRAVSEQLDELISRYDFVLTGTRRLHQAVAETIRSYLMDPDRRLDVRDANERAAGLLARRLADRARLLTTLDDRLEDDNYLRDLLSLIWHRFWVDNDLGWSVLLAVFPVLAVLGQHEPALDIAARFAAAGSPSEERRLDALRAAAGTGPPGWAEDHEARVRQSAIRMLRNAPGADDPLSSPAERRCALAILEARLTRDAVPRMTLLAEASAGATPGTQLAAALGSDLLDALYEAVWPGGSRDAVEVPEAPAAALAATRVVPDDAEAWHFLSIVRGFDRSGYMVSAEAGRSAARLDPTDPRYLLDQAVPLAYAGRVDEAMALLDEALRVEVAHLTAWTSLGFLYLRHGLVRQAVECQRAAVELEPASGNARQQLAAALLAAGDADSAVIEELALDAVRLDPTLALGWLRYSMELARREDYAGAREAAQEAVRRAGGTRHQPLARASLAAYLHADGQVSPASGEFAEGARCWPQAWRQGNSFAADMLWIRALCELGQGSPSQAMETLAEAMRALPPGMGGDPLMADLLTVLSRGPALAGFDDFRRGSRAMIAPGPATGPTPEEELAHARRLAALADLLSRREDPAAAVPLHECALRIRERLLPPDDAAVLASVSGLGVAQYQAGQAELAAPNLERALAARERLLPAGHPDIAATARWLGLAVWWLSDADRAAGYLRQAARRGPGQDADEEGLALYGQIQWAVDNRPEARAVLTEVVELSDRMWGPYHPQTSIHLRRLGSLLWAQHDLSQAEACFARANAIDPEGLLPADPDEGAVSYGDIGEAGARSLIPVQSPDAALWTDELLAPELDAVIQGSADVPGEFRRSTVVTLGQSAGDVTAEGGSESDLLHFGADIDGQERVFLPVFTRMPALMAGLAKGGPMWWSLSVLAIEGGALLDNVDPDVTVVINPWTWLEYQIPPGAR